VLLGASLLTGCGISALVPTREMPVEQQVSIVAQRMVLFPLTITGSEIALAVKTHERSEREAALRASGGLEAAADQAGAETAYQDRIRPSVDLTDPFTRFVLEARLWLAGELDAGRLTLAQAFEALDRVRLEVLVLRARRENFAPASFSLRRTLWAAGPGITMEGVQRETELFRRYRLDCPTERIWGDVVSQC
jgi:hypothetical protein